MHYFEMKKNNKFSGNQKFSEEGAAPSQAIPHPFGAFGASTPTPFLTNRTLVKVLIRR